MTRAGNRQSINRIGIRTRLERRDVHWLYIDQIRCSYRYKAAGVTGAIAAKSTNLLASVLFIMLTSLLYSKQVDIPFVIASPEMIHYAIFAMIIAVAI